jgi:hypothetical protein
MSLVDKTSPDLAMPSDLEIFTSASTDLTVQENNESSHNPISMFRPDGGDVIFEIKGNQEDYLKLNRSCMTMGLQIQRSNGDIIDDSDLVAFENNAAHTIFSGCQVTIGNQTVTYDMHYNHGAQLHNLVNFGPDAKKSHLTMALYEKDTAGCMDAHYQTPAAEATAAATAAAEWLAVPANNVVPDWPDARKAQHYIRAAKHGLDSVIALQNVGLQKRASYTRANKIVRVRVPILCDVFAISKYIVSNVDMVIKFIRAPVQFALHAHINDVAPREYKINIIEPKLWITKVKIFPTVFVGHSKNIEIKEAKYNITRRVTKPVMIPQGTTSFTADNITVGQLPKRVICGFKRNSAYDGHYAQNPFNYEHLSLIRIALWVNGRCNPLTPFAPVYTGENPEYMRPFSSVFSAMGIHHSNRGLDINRDDYPNGYCLYAFDLTPNQSASLAAPITLKNTGNTRLEFLLSAPTTAPYICMMYLEFDNIIRIDSDRNVYADYSM